MFRVSVVLDLPTTASQSIPHATATDVPKEQPEDDAVPTLYSADDDSVGATALVLLLIKVAVEPPRDPTVSAVELTWPSSPIMNSLPVVVVIPLRVGVVHELEQVALYGKF